MLLFAEFITAELSKASGKMREAMGDVFEHTIILQGMGGITCLPMSDLIKECIQEAAGEKYWEVPYYRGEQYSVIGRRTGYGLGGDLIVVHQPTRHSPDSRLWPANQLTGDWYKWVVVRECCWNDGYVTAPPSETGNHPNDVIIASGLAFAKQLEEVVRARMNQLDNASR